MYTEKIFHQFGIDTISVATTGDKAGMAFGAVPVSVMRLTYTVRIANTGTAVIAFDKIPANAGTRGSSDVGMITIPANPILGKVYYKDVSVRLIPGDTVMAEVTTAGASGSGHIGLYASFDSDVPANQAHMILST